MEELLQLALVQFVFVSIVSRVFVENCYQRVHRALELTWHSAGRTVTLCGFLEMKMVYVSQHKNEMCLRKRTSYLLGVARKCDEMPQRSLLISK